MWPAMYAFSLPTKADKVPIGSDWIHEIKYDGYRRDCDQTFMQIHAEANLQ
jgi:ATP-dependent DNA ligase